MKQPGKSTGQLPVIFQHIPKTAGVSVRSVMSCNFHLQEILHVPDQYWCDTGFSADAVRQYRFIHGHLHFEFVKSHLDGGARVVTFLRDPVERALSLYFFMRKQAARTQPDPAAPTATDRAGTLSVVEFMEQPDRMIASIISNYQLRVLLDTQQTSGPARAWVEGALGNLERYQFVGIADPDLIGESMRAMSRRFGWHTASEPPRVNHTTRPNNHPEIARAREVIAARNELEIQLYNEVRARFLSSLSAKTSSGQQGAQQAQRKQYRTGLTSPVTMDQPLRCWGWHDRETTPSRPDCWRCAAGLRAGLELKVPKGNALILMFELVSARARVSVPDTQIEVEGRLLSSTVFFSHNRWVIGAVVEPQDIGTDGFLSVEIVCQERAADGESEPETPDSRYVTIGLERIDILSAETSGTLTFDILRQSIQQAAARGAERRQAAEHQAALLDRAERAEAYCVGLQSELAKRTEDARALQASHQKERLEAGRYQDALTDRAVRAETYGAYLVSELTKHQQQVAELQAAQDRHRIEAERHNAALVDRAARAEAYCAALTERAARSEAYCATLLAEVQKHRNSHPPSEAADAAPATSDDAARSDASRSDSGASELTTRSGAAG